MVAAIGAFVLGVLALIGDDGWDCAARFFGMSVANLIYPVGLFLHLGGALYQNRVAIAEFFGFNSSAKAPE